MMENIMLQVRPVAGLIKTNFDEIEKQLAADMCQYDGIIFTEDTKTDAKKKVAELRKLKKSIEDSRKEVKAQWMEPYNQFEARVKQVAALVDKPINHINGQVEEFEAKRLKERQTEIEQIYTEEIGDMADFLPLYRLQEDKWGNASTSIKSIRKSMSETIANTRAGKAAIEAMQSDAVPDALRKFQATLSLPDALAYINRYEAQKAEILRKEEERRHQEEERRHQEEMERVRKDERQRMAHEERIRKDAEEAVRAEIKSVDEENAAPLTAPNSHTAVYTVVGTDAELQEVEMAMTSLGLYFERKDV
ncbi:DUF1351 domain-containing protein [Enterocloster citroniae]|uniref:DUF1351 domain-containing protein n=2 Tax=Enterocloster citroniae TaxID=358743 RepID=A0ABV2G427_9FIRM|nr:DUF1351 domain-containing protein [Enterocloster citroniae]KMW23720.1 hypothetical protein HMPREF9470_00936 [[Clostridium] citroniae WAL-19142]MCB7067044.1 DUF1351 domain-containing protein [Enterocloster citroniae]